MVLLLYAPSDYADDLSTANDPLIRPQTIPRPKMIPANDVAKYLACVAGARKGKGERKIGRARGR